MKEDLEGMQGQLQGLSLTLTALLTALPPAVARQIATTLQASLDVERENSDSLPAGYSTNRDALVQAYLELLRSRSQPA